MRQLSVFCGLFWLFFFFFLLRLLRLLLLLPASLARGRAHGRRRRGGRAGWTRGAWVVCSEARFKNGKSPLGKLLFSAEEWRSARG